MVICSTTEVNCPRSANVEPTRSCRRGFIIWAWILWRTEGHWRISSLQLDTASDWNRLIDQHIPWRMIVSLYEKLVGERL